MEKEEISETELIMRLRIERRRREAFGWVKSRYGRAYGEDSGVKIPIWKRRNRDQVGCLDVGTT